MKVAHVISVEFSLGFGAVEPVLRTDSFGSMDFNENSGIGTSHLVVASYHRYIVNNFI